MMTLDMFHGTFIDSLVWEWFEMVQTISETKIIITLWTSPSRDLINFDGYSLGNPRALGNGGDFKRLEWLNCLCIQFLFFFINLCIYFDDYCLSILKISAVERLVPVMAGSFVGVWKHH